MMTECKAHGQQAHDEWCNALVLEALLRGPNFVYEVHPDGRRNLKHKTYAPLRNSEQVMDERCTDKACVWID